MKLEVYNLLFEAGAHATAQDLRDAIVRTVNGMTDDELIEATWGDGEQYDISDIFPDIYTV